MLALVLATGLATAAAFSPAGRAPVRGRAPSPAMSDDLFLGIDCGTQGLKAVVYDAVGKATIGVGSVAYGLLPSTEVGCAEQDPAVWVGAMHDAAAQGTSAASTGACVRGVGVSECWGCRAATVDGATLALRRCAGCGVARYCSRDCQRRHRGAHRKHCAAATPGGAITSGGAP